jgi:chromosomal replication initiator protein
VSADLDTRILNLHDKNITPYDIGRRVGLTSYQVRERLSENGIKVRLPFGSYENRLWEDTSEDRLRKAIIAQDEAFKAAVRSVHFPEPEPEPEAKAVEPSPPPAAIMPPAYRFGVPEIVPLSEPFPAVSAPLPRDVINVGGKRQHRPEPFVTPGNRIIGEVALKHNVTVLELKSPRREKRITLARHEACYRLKNETSLSLPQIGKLLGGRDHTTVLHGARRIERMIAEAQKGGAA